MRILPKGDGQHYFVLVVAGQAVHAANFGGDMTIVEAVVTFAWGVLVISAAIYMAAQNIRLRVRLYRMENELKRAGTACDDASNVITEQRSTINELRSTTLTGVFPKKRVEPLPPSTDNWAEIIEEQEK